MNWVRAVSVLLAFAGCAEPETVERSAEALLSVDLRVQEDGWGAVTINFDGMLGSPSDWIAIAPVGSSSEATLAWQYSGGVAAGSISFTSLPVGGPYEARAFHDWAGTGSYVVQQTSEPFTVGPGAATVRSDLALYDASTGPTVSFSGVPASAQNWVGLAPLGSADDALVSWAYTPASPSGQLALPAVAVPGRYVLRLYLNNTFQRVAESVPFEVDQRAVLTVPSGVITTNQSFLVEVSNAPSTANNWLAIAAVGAEDSAFQSWAYLPSGSSSVTLNAPQTPGTYVVRLFLANTLNRNAESAPFEVTYSAATVSAPVAVASGTAYTVDFANFPGGPTDWIAVAPTGSATSEYVAWRYTGGLISGQVVFGGLTPGVYEARGYFSNSYETRSTTTFSVADNRPESVRSTGAVSNGGSSQATVSSDGRYIAFISTASNLVTGDTNGRTDIFIRDTQLGSTTRILGIAGAQPNQSSSRPNISANGRYVAFVSSASNLVSPDANGTSASCFVFDRQTLQTAMVDVGANGACSYVTVSDDGVWASFSSAASNLVSGDTNGRTDIFMRNRSAGTTQRLSIGPTGTQATSDSTFPVITPSGDFVAFISGARALDPTKPSTRVEPFVYVRATGLLDRLRPGSLAVNNSARNMPAISADGRYVVFQSSTSNYVTGDTNGRVDVFLFDRTTRQIVRVSVGAAGVQSNGDASVEGLWVSNDGQSVLFTSAATNMVTGDTNAATDIFLRNVGTSTTSRVSVTRTGLQLNGASQRPLASQDGRTVVFETRATNFGFTDTNNNWDVWRTFL